MNLKRIFLIFVLPIVLGGVVGFAYYHFIGCASGSCPITSNPYISTAYGSGMGVVWALGSLKKKK